MGKKKKMKFETNQKAISDYIFSDYVADVEASVTENALKDMPLLISNELAVRICGEEYRYSTSVSIYKIASKFMQEYNKKLKEYRRKLDDYEVGGDNGVYVFMDSRLVELAKYSLEPGTYYAQLDKSEYAVLDISQSDNDEDDSMVKYQLYFVGKKCKKWKEKFYKIVDEYKAIKKEEKHERIYYTDGKPSISSIFKSFDKCIFAEKENTLKYIDNFINHIPDYYAYGMTPKLSIMCYGRPGTGKSTFGKALANYLNIDSVTAVSPDFFESHDEPSYGRGRGGRGNAPYQGMPTVYSLDDIDCVCKSREESDSRENTAALANLLAFLDNPPTFDYKAKDGVHYPISIIVASTNYYDKLDDAVKRPGRFDYTIEMPYFTKKEAQEMCDIYGLRLEDIVKDSDKKSFTIGPSALQALCLENIDKSMKTVE